LIADLAIRLYKSDYGRLPGSLAELKPGYVDHLPMDPFDGGSIKFQRRSEGYILYCGTTERDEIVVDGEWRVALPLLERDVEGESNLAEGT